ncbi:unnamed protein product [Pleuronectes platessa]|uniref:Uncharacterized protein n=1 Tax=Pleuronectes platessa TaxID=8262 RepID=A0A9N7Z6E9_PLEPL|nr:unnamed protein product [Pleuronectes platessa]
MKLIHREKTYLMDMMLGGAGQTGPGSVLVRQVLVRLVLVRLVLVRQVLVRLVLVQFFRNLLVLSLSESVTVAASNHTQVCTTSQKSQCVLMVQGPVSSGGRMDLEQRTTKTNQSFIPEPRRTTRSKLTNELAVAETCKGAKDVMTPLT